MRDKWQFDWTRTSRNDCVVKVNNCWLTFAFYKEAKMFENPGAIEASRLETVVKYLKEQGDLAASVTPQKLYDPAVAVTK